MIWDHPYFWKYPYGSHEWTGRASYIADFFMHCRYRFGQIIRFHRPGVNPWKENLLKTTWEKNPSQTTVAIIWQVSMELESYIHAYMCEFSDEPIDTLNQQSMSSESMTSLVRWCDTDLHDLHTASWHRSSWSPCHYGSSRVWRERIEPLEGKVVWPSPSWGCGGILGLVRSRFPLFVVGVVTPVWLTERASDPPYHFDCGSHIGSGALRARVWGVAASSLVTRKARSHVWWGWITGCNYSWNFEWWCEGHVELTSFIWSWDGRCKRVRSES